MTRWNPADLDLMKMQIEALFTHDAAVTFTSLGAGGTMMRNGHDAGATMGAPGAGMRT